MPPGCERAETRREGSQPRVSDSRVGVSVPAAARLHPYNAFSPVVYKVVVSCSPSTCATTPCVTSSRTQGGARHAPRHPRGCPRGPHREQASPGGQHPGLRRVARAHRVHVRTRPTRARPALHLLALCLRTALDHVAGDNPADDRAVALRAATRWRRDSGGRGGGGALNAPPGALAPRCRDGRTSDPFRRDAVRGGVLLARTPWWSPGIRRGSPPRHCSRRRH